MNILFTCAGRRNYLINYFKQALDGQGKVYATDMQLTAPALVDADVAIQVPEIYASDYIVRLKEIIKSHNIDAVISLNDLELPILSRHKKELEAVGTRVIVSNEEVIKIAFDKWETVRFLEKCGLNTPKTFINLNDAQQAIKAGEIAFPLIVKPRWGSASIGINVAEDMRELELAFELQTIGLKRSILTEASKEDADRAILIQKKLTGKEYGVDVLNDFDGNYIGSFVRQKYAMRSGETDKAISVIDERFNALGRVIGENLRHIGNLDCDVFDHNGRLYVLELNPRFGGGYPFSHEAGMNTAAVYIDWLKGCKDIAHLNNYQAGMMFSKCDRLMRVN